MDGKGECNSKGGTSKDNAASSSMMHNNGHDTGEDTSRSGGESSPSMHVKTSRRQSKRRNSSPAPLEPRSSKRTRLQYQPFQSPTLHIPQLRASKATDEKEVVFYKGEFLALRNESGSFFVCQAAQNVYKRSHRFKIRWLSKCDNAGPDMYSRDFYDYTDFECVLTNLQLERMDKNLFRLSKSEVARTETILKRAINLENGIHDMEQDQNEADSGSESERKVEPVAKDIGRVVARKTVVERTKPQPESLKVPAESLKAHVGRRLRITVTRNQPATRAAKAKLQKVILNSRLKAAKVTKVNKVKIKKKAPKAVSRSNGHKRDTLVLKKTPPRKPIVAVDKDRDKEREKPKVNAKISLYNKDPMFESNNHMVPFVSTLANSKLLIRAVLMHDNKSLLSMLDDSAKTCWVGVQRSVDQKLDALAYALIQKNGKAIQLIMAARQKSSKFLNKFSDTLFLHHNVGRSLGSAVREITLSRGAREGNSALMKDCHDELTDLDYIMLMMKHGVSKSTFDLFLSELKENKHSLKSAVLSNIWRAIRWGRRHLAASLIEEALRSDSYSFTPVHREVLIFERQEFRSCRPSIVKKRCVGNCGVTPVHCAAINPSAKYLRSLLDADSDGANLGDLQMRRPIHYAAACEGPAPLELLLSRGCKSDDVDGDGNTALHVAAETGRAANVEVLLKRTRTDKGSEAKASRDHGLGGINRPNRVSFTPLHLACNAGNLDVVKVLLKYGADAEKTSGVNSSKVTPLMLACQQGHLETVKFLVHNKAKLESRDKLRRTAATHAIINGHAHIVSHLLRLGCNPDTMDSSGNSLLHYAVAYGWWFCVNLLLDSGASLNQSNDWKVTPLGIAFLKGHIGLVDSLLSQPNVDIEFRDDNGMTIVMLAVCSPLTVHLADIIRTLVVDKKAKCNIVDVHGNTALHWLASNSIHLDSRESTLVGTGRPRSPALKHITSLNLSHKGPVLCTMAVQIGLKVAKILLENNCDASVRNHRGQTALTLAIQQGNNELVKMLLSDGCQVTAEVDDTGENLLHALVDHSWETDLASLVHVIKDSAEKKNKYSATGEESVEMNLHNPAIPLFESLDGVLKLGDIIKIEGLRSKTPEKISFGLVQGRDPEKDDVLFECSVRQSESGALLVCRRRLAGEWKGESKDAETTLSSISSAVQSQGNDGKVSFGLSLTLNEDQLVLSDSIGGILVEFPVDSLPRQGLSLHVAGDVVINSIKVHRPSTSKSFAPTASLPSDVLREMAQTYSYDGFTPLLLACRKYHFTTDKKHQARLRDMIKTLVEEADSEVHAVVKKRSDNKSRNIDGFSALHFLASAREIQFVGAARPTDPPSSSAMLGLQLLLNYKPPINIQDHRGRTPLITAILSRQAAAAEALVHAGADVNFCSSDVDEDGCASPLILAAKLGLVPVIKLLLKHGANVQLADAKNHSTALHYSVTMKASTDALEVVQCLIDAGININSVNQDGRTPLHLAVNANAGCSDDIVEVEDLMIEKGADLMARDSLGRLPLHYAFVKIGRPVDSSVIDPIEVVSLLTGAMKSGMDIADHYGQTPLHCAAFRGATISCMHLAQTIANINAKDKNGNTALSLAVLGSHDSCAIMLLQKGSSIQVDIVMPPLEPRPQDREKAWQWKQVMQMSQQPQRSPLLQEVVKKDWQGVMFMMLGQLQASGANFFPAIEAALRTGKFKLALNLIARSKNHGKINTCNGDEQNLLHVLASMAKSSDQPELQVKVAQVLINRGVPINVPDMHGSFPVTYAAMNRNIALCEFFTIQLGVDVVSKLPADHLGRTPLSAVFWGLRPLQWRDANLHELRLWCLKLFSCGASSDILVAYPYLDSFPGETWTMLDDADATEGETNSRVPDCTCRISPLIFSICLRDYDLVSFLIERGADVNFSDENGRTPLMFAVRKNDIAMARLLLNPRYCYKKDVWCILKKKRLSRLRDKGGSASHTTRKVGRGNAVRLQTVLAPTSTTSQSNRFKRDNAQNLNQNATSIGNISEVNGDSLQVENIDMKLFNSVGDADDQDDDNEKDERIEVDDDDEDEDGEINRMLLDATVEPVSTNRTSCAVNLVKTDRNGSTLIHHLVRPFTCGSYDNTDMLHLLAEAGAPLDVANAAGFTPLQMAVQGRVFRLAAALRRLSGKHPADCSVRAPIVEVTVKDGINWDQDAWDYKVDAAAILERVESEAMEEGDEDSLVLPDVHSGMEDMGVVVTDVEQNIPYDVFMTRVDLSSGAAGCYSFYKMQVISQQGRNLYILFARWGKLGTEGEFQQTPHCVLDDAIKEFCRIFKAKSGSSWQEVKKFQPVPRKYRLVEALQRGRKKLRDIPLKLSTDLPSNLSPELQTLLHHLCHVPILQEACQDVGIDTAVMPFSRLCEAALRHGRHILRELKNVVTDKMKLETDLKMRDKIWELAEKIVDLSSEYFQAVPQPGYIYEKVRPLDKLQDIQSCLNSLEYMFDLELVSKILLGGQLKIKDVNTLDYVYRAMDCQISAMQEDEIESQYILQYIRNTSVTRTPAVERIYRVSRKAEADRSRDHENRWLLWHGVHVAKMISVLVRGLDSTAAPTATAATDDKSGQPPKDDGSHREFRFADTFEMAQEMGDFQSRQKGVARYALLCEVYLGNICDPNVVPSSAAATAYSSTSEGRATKLAGTYFPDPTCNLIMTSGMTIPLGSMTCRYNAAGETIRGQADYNEYAMSSRGCVNIRYIVRYRYDQVDRAQKANKVPTHS